MTGLLAGKVAIVTGAGSGIGRATALLFREEGASVVGVDIAAASLESLAAESPGITTCTADVTAADDVARIFAAVTATFGRLDVLVNNAGIGGPRALRLHEVPLDDFDRVMNVNLRAPLVMTRGALEIMLPQGGGAIVNTVSTSAYHVVPGVASYCISKAGIAMLTRAIAKEYAADGIRCNGVAPGVVQTPILEGLTQEQMDQMLAGIPQKRVGQPREIAQTIAFLASERSSYINGSIVTIDGAAGT